MSKKSTSTTPGHLDRRRFIQAGTFLGLGSLIIPTKLLANAKGH